MCRVRTILSRIPDVDDTLRRLSNVLRVPSGCRRRACRTMGRCQGGYGPPCYFENRKRFADAVLEDMHQHRAYWDEHRAGWEADLRGTGKDSSSAH